MAETPFKISIPDSALDLLHRKLAATVFPDELEQADWDYGAPLSDIRRLVILWANGYDWRKHEAQINATLPQFTRDIAIDGFGTLNIHYVHQRSRVEGAIPLLFVHGWPGSFLEVRKILPLLVNSSAEHPSFHVVALSLPGYGFSEAPKKKGFAQEQYAEVGNKLMLALGYNEYVTQGGDWGALITRFIAYKYGHKHSKAWHINLPTAQPPTFTQSPLIYLSDLLFGYNKREKEGLARAAWYRDKSAGYFKQQSTMPQTLGYSLADSPVGLLAWIYEKLVTWTDDDYHWDDEEVLTWISVYWFSRAGPTASLRTYYEIVKKTVNPFYTLPPITIPTGHSYFPRELLGFPRRWFKAQPALVFESEHDAGGHFAATEKPAELVADLRKMFGKGGPAYGVVGKTGYQGAVKAKL